MSSVNLTLAEKQSLIWSALIENGRHRKSKISQTPYLMSIATYNELARRCELILNCLEKFVGNYAISTKVQSLFPELVTYRDLTCIRPSSKHSIHIARFDLIEDRNGKFKILETNAGSPVFMKCSLVQNVFEKLGFIPLDVVKQPTDDPIFFATSLIDLSKEVLANDSPNIALLTNRKAPHDLNLCEKFVKTAGLNCIKMHHQDLQFRPDGRIYCGDLPIDIVFQKLDRVINNNGQATTFLWDEVEDPSRSSIRVYVDGLVTKKFVLANHMSSFLVAENKRTLALLRRPGLQTDFTNEEREAINELIPDTFSFDHTNQAQFLNLVDEFVQNKGQWVIKSAVNAKSKAVWIGKQCNNEFWNELIRKLPSEPYIIQRFVDQNETLVLTPSEEPTLKSMFSTVSIFIVRGKASGLNCRSAEDMLVNFKRNGCTRPAWVVKNTMRTT